MLEGLIAYLDSIKARDPAPRSRWEVLLYPGVWALAYHRVAHWLWTHGLKSYGRLWSQHARRTTGIEIPDPSFADEAPHDTAKETALARFIDCQRRLCLRV